ncbi:hypothetical protein J8N08_16615 [Agrobacterium tumefaciens]|uniref:hypothetical protein n=1 Tax=Agrobacterium tumefaciens TaxID=358 RepID=UPI001BB50650|nr:hypothetical protein J8N08_16615 [Agrobacterium tumefaciens]
MRTPAKITRDYEKARVTRIAGIADRCHGDQWEVAADGGRSHIIAQRATGEHVLVCTIHPEALPDEIELIVGALDNVSLFLTLRQRAIIALKHAYEQARDAPTRMRLREGDFAANAAMLCAEPLFHRYLERRDKTRVIYNKDHADTVLKKLIGITSKKQLNTEERAQKAFLDLRADYQTWKERGRA